MEIEYRTWFSSKKHECNPLPFGEFAMACVIRLAGHEVASGYATRPMSAILPLESFAALKSSDVWLEMQSESLSQAEQRLREIQDHIGARLDKAVGL